LFALVVLAWSLDAPPASVVARESFAAQLELAQTTPPTMASDPMRGVILHCEDHRACATRDGEAVIRQFESAHDAAECRAISTPAMYRRRPTSIVSIAPALICSYVLARD
jgi:hypothetical protein